MPNATTARRKRRRQRGAVLVEGLIVASMLALCLTCAVFFHDLYSAKITQAGEARRQAWEEALPGCSGGLLTAITNSVGQLSALTVADQNDLVDAPDGLVDMGRGVGSPATRTVSSGPLMGNEEFTLESRRSVACNESGHQAEDDSILGAIFRTIRDMFPF